MKFRDRIVEFTRVRADELLPNPRNWRTHDERQQAALAGVLEDRAPRRRMAFGGAMASAVLLAALFEPTYTSIFLQRLVGRDVAWPQLTWLTVSIPNLSDRAKIELGVNEIEVRVARWAIRFQRLARGSRRWLRRLGTWMISLRCQVCELGRH